MSAVLLVATARNRSRSPILRFTARSWGALWARKASGGDRDAAGWGPQQLHQQQQYATPTADGSKQGIPLKTALRQLYKRVHPDLFTDYPAEQVPPRASLTAPTCVK